MVLDYNMNGYVPEKQDWDKVETVIDEYTKIAKQKRFHCISTGVSWMNMWHLEDMIARHPIPF